MEKMIAKASKLTTAQIKESLIALASDLSTEATMVTGVLLNVLETSISETEFLSFCEELEAA